MFSSVRASFSGKEIYDSGTIIIRDLQQPITIEILPTVLGSAVYQVRLIFSRLESQQGSVVRWVSPETGVLLINMINFDSPWGLTPHEPITVGYYENLKILLDFAVYTLGDDPNTAPKLLFYTLHAGGAVDG
jgi:hypothetical protein